MKNLTSLDLNGTRFKAEHIEKIRSTLAPKLKTLLYEVMIFGRDEDDLEKNKSQKIVILALYFHARGGTIGHHLLDKERKIPLGTCSLTPHGGRVVPTTK